MADEPSNGELARRLDEIARLLRDVPARGEYLEYQRRVDQRFADMAADIAEVRHVHDVDVKEHQRRHDDDRKQRGTDWRQALYQGLMPFAVAAAAVLLGMWLAKGGK